MKLKKKKMNFSNKILHQFCFVLFVLPDFASNATQRGVEK